MRTEPIPKLKKSKPRKSLLEGFDIDSETVDWGNGAFGEIRADSPPLPVQIEHVQTEPSSEIEATSEIEAPLKTKSVLETKPDLSEHTQIEHTQVKPANFQSSKTKLAESKVTESKVTENKRIEIAQIIEEALSGPLETSNKLVTNKEQTDNKLVTNKEQAGRLESNDRGETSNKLVTQLVTQLVTNNEQTSNKLVTKTDFASLVGLQRNCILYIYNSCRFIGSKTSGQIAMENMASTCKSTTGAMHVTVERLKKKEVITLARSKEGRGGWRQFTLSDEIYNALIHDETSNKLVTNKEQTDNKLVTQLVTQLVTNAPSSSSSSFNKETKETTTSELPEAWDEIDYSRVEKWHFGRTHLLQVYQSNSKLAQGLTPDEVQDSLDAFAHSMETDSSKVINPLAMIMKPLRNGTVFGPKPGFKSRKVKADENRAKFAKDRLDAMESRKKAEIELGLAEFKKNMTDEMRERIAQKYSWVGEVRTGPKFESAINIFWKENNEELGEFQG